MKIFTWNIEQFGNKRSAYEAQVNTVVDIIADSDADIVVLIEIKTTKPEVAITIARLLCEILQQKHKQYYGFNVSDHNFLEVYVFLYRYEKVTPYVLKKAQWKMYDYDSLAKETLVKVEDYQQSSRYVKNGSFYNVEYAIPLLTFPYQYGKERPLGAGLFCDESGKKTAVLAWHNMAGRFGNNSYPGGIMEDAGTADYIKKGFDLKTNEGPFDIKEVVVTGDFNADPNKDDKAYKAYAGYKTMLTENTYLKYWDSTKDGSYNNTLELRNACYDNFIVKSTRNKASKVVDIPNKLIKEAKLRNYLINSGSLAVMDDLIEIIREMAAKKLGKMFTSPYIRKKDRALMLEEIETAPVNNMKIDESALRVLKNKLQKRKYDEVVKYLNDELAKAGSLVNHFQNVLNGTSNLGFNDALLLTRQILSDHLPVTLTLT